MLDGYVSEKEQLEALRKWWQENGKFLVIAIIVGLAIGFGWRYWHAFQLRRAENASLIYQTVLQSDSQNKIKTVEGGAALLMNQFPSTPYASLAALLYAKEAVAKNDLPTALSKLQWVLNHSDEKRLKQIARISAARILLAQGKTADAMNELKVVDDTHFEPLIQWVTGDIYAREGNTKQATHYYTIAKNALAEFPPAVNYLNQQLAE